MQDVMEMDAAQGDGQAGGQALYVQGLLALREGRAQDALDLLARARDDQPDHPGIRRNLMRAGFAAGRFAAVLEAAGADAEDAELCFMRGTALNALGRPEAACAAFDRAVRLRPDHAASWLNYGNALADLGENAAAEALYRRAISLDPALPEAHASLGYVLTRQGRIEAAIAACEAAIRLRPDFAQAHWNRAVATLLGGDLGAGFARYEWRKRHPLWQDDFPPLPQPEWDGGDPAGKTILVRAEQGLGDTIQFARYLPLIARRGGRPILACQPTLAPLLRSLPGTEVVTLSGPLPACDAWADLLSLPWLMGTVLDTIPCPDGYLSARPEAIRTWRARLPPGPRVGLAFAGNGLNPQDKGRSISAEHLPDVGAFGDIRFVNLQHGAAASGLKLPDLSRWMTDFAETAALIQSLDLVISVDTAVAHLAGALGKSVWILLPAAPDWRWMLNRTDSPWYRSARLFRQATPGDWQPVLAEAFDALRHGVITRRKPPTQRP